MRHFECPHCQETPTVEVWNKYNEQAITFFGMDPLPQCFDEEDEAASMDFPKCEERIMIVDLNEV